MNKNVEKTERIRSKYPIDGFREDFKRLLAEYSAKGLIVKRINVEWSEDDTVHNIRMTYTEPNSNNTNLPSEGSGSQQKNN